MPGILDPDPRTFDRIRVIVAALYWLTIPIVMIALAYADPGWAKGGIPILIVTLPWSILVLPLVYFVLEYLPVFKILGDDAGNFFVWGIICGGLNVVIIVGISRVWGWWRRSLNFRIGVVTSIVALLGVAHFVGPIIEKDARERRRPQNIPREAVGLGGMGEWWQFCTYDSARHMNLCRTWNGDGVILKDGEFVPYDGGPPATTDELQIVDDPRSGLDTVVLQDGRILIPKEQESRRKR